MGGAVEVHKALKLRSWALMSALFAAAIDAPWYGCIAMFGAGVFVSYLVWPSSNNTGGQYL